MKNLTEDQKRLRVLELYTIDEICEILGYYDHSNTDLDFETLENLELTDIVMFELMIVNEAINNGNFEEAINNNERFAL